MVTLVGSFFYRQFEAFLGYLKRYYKEDFKWSYFLFLIITMAGYIYWAYPDGTYSNYRLFRNGMVEKHGVFLYHLVLYGLPFVVAFVGFMFLYKRFDLLKKPQFWMLAIFAVGVFAFRQYAQSASVEPLSKVSFEHYPNFWRRVIRDIIKMAAAMLPVTIYWLWDRKSSETPYGFTLKNFNLRPYFLILLIMLPFVVGFGLTDHFTGYYPRGLKNLDYYFGYGVDPPARHLLFYELIYGLDFVSIEYFFRGFLVIAFARFVGPGAILPMACFYVSIHFGKPMVETMSSFFGGSILGILSYYSRSIWGGIVVHMGIAWLMEIGAFLASTF